MEHISLGICVSWVRETHFTVDMCFLCMGTPTTRDLFSRIGEHIHRIHKWRSRGKKLGPSHVSEALEDKQKLQIKTFSELAECLARIPPQITLYGRLFKYNDVERLLLLMFSTDLLFAITRDAYIFKETG